MQLKSLHSFMVMFISLGTMAQTEAGMNFIKAESWAEVKAQAKAENKYIFLDGYTTWCGPCIMMAKKIFPLPEVGEFYNANFINVKVQLDTTEKDNDHVKKWYKDGHDLMTAYGINAFPTYLFFSPDGEIVHRAVGSSDGERFIGKGKDALNPDKQYYSLSREYEKGNREAAFLRKLLKAAQESYDSKNIPIFTKAFFDSKPDLLTVENLGLVLELTKSSTDTGFILMQQYPEKFDDAFKKKGTANEIVISIILKEEFYPNLNDGEKLNESIDWASLENKVALKYPRYAHPATLRAKVMYYRMKEDFPAFASSVTDLMKSAGDTPIEPEALNGFAWMIFEKCNDMNCIMQALSWSKNSIEGNNDPIFIDTYANLLHKSRNTPEAIKWQKKAIEILKQKGEESDEYEETLAKMEKGEKTWN